jgi:hypothetical protein
VEGQVNRLKTIKRQMYGRASFELLKKMGIGRLKLINTSKIDEEPVSPKYTGTNHNRGRRRLGGLVRVLDVMVFSDAHHPTPKTALRRFS